MILLSPSNTPTSPAYQRFQSFLNYFSDCGMECNIISHPVTIIAKIKLFFWLTFGRHKYLFITMPPFSNFWVFFIPWINIILDIRDGWSIAMTGGYGGTSRKKPLKSKIAIQIEKFAIQRSFLSITCTPGLQKHLSKISNRKIHLITNGVSDEDLSEITEIKKDGKNHVEKNKITFCCAGQFSEYGKDKVANLLNILEERYGNNKMHLQLIGSDKLQNEWVIAYFNKLTKGKGTVEILPRMDRHQMYNLMSDCNYALTIIRDPHYEFGTKIFDYIAIGLPVVNPYDKRNAFTDYFDFCLDKPLSEGKHTVPEIQRSKLIKEALAGINFK